MTTARRRAYADERPCPRRVRRAIGQVAGGHARLGAAPRAPLAEGAGGALARAAQPVRSGHAPVVRGVQVHGRRTLEEPAALLERAALARAPGGGVPGG